MYLRTHNQRFFARRSSKLVPINNHAIAHLDKLAQADGFSRKHVAWRSPSTLKSTPSLPQDCRGDGQRRPIQ